MKKEAFCLLFLLSANLSAYVPEELVFTSIDSLGTVLSVKGQQAFYRDVVNGKKPAVIKIFTGAEHPAAQEAYQQVAEQFSDRVVFARAQFSDIAGVIHNIMGRLGVRQVTLPIFLFFNKNSLMLPIVSGTVSKENFITRIKKTFFPQTVSMWDKVFSGLQNVSREIKAYQLSQARKRRKTF